MRRLISRDPPVLHSPSLQARQPQPRQLSCCGSVHKPRSCIRVSAFHVTARQPQFGCRRCPWQPRGQRGCAAALAAVTPAWPLSGRSILVQVRSRAPWPTGQLRNSKIRIVNYWIITRTPHLGTLRNVYISGSSSSPVHSLQITLQIT